ncbi:FAD-binding oxidoreductase [Burkholderia sp. Tr-862]|uniref:NAD(P)/FAD-dependent oxidoreductase n=1 Tax=Burkholderia sp. Tr-862 TaxID=2608331 RepID=UPI001419E13B|nr:FAD-dependent oxidoreductase [Burkholderia sp. Tr-862]NIF39976.1 FAD-binding oxidoreductase [Burkholderia sp. Tr-862]
MRETADVVVVGGGTTGCGIAWHLAQAGTNVRLLERADIAAGSSGASPGIVRLYYADPALVALASDGSHAYRHWSETVGGDCRFRRTGFLTAVAPEDWNATHAYVDSLRSKGFALSLLSVDDMRGLCSDIDAEGLAGAVYEADAGYCDARASALAFAHGARASGAQIDTRCEVRGIRLQGGRVVGVDTDRGSIDCAVVVNAAGPWAARLAASCGVELPIAPSRQCVAIVRADDGGRASLPGFSDRRGGFYLRPDLPRHYFIGSLQASDSGAIDVDGFDTRMGDAEQLRYRVRAARRFARIDGATPAGSRVSFFDDTPDGNPLFGADPRVQGLFVAAGLSGHGFKLAPVFGQGVADWLETGRLRPELRAFDVMRFEKCASR